MFIHTAKCHIYKYISYSVSVLCAHDSAPPTQIFPSLSSPPPSSPLTTCFCVGLPKSSEQAYIEFESIEAIVKTASRTKFFIEFYSTCLEGETDIHQDPPGVTSTARVDLVDVIKLYLFLLFTSFSLPPNLRQSVYL